jgi:hypothetical protein
MRIKTLQCGCMFLVGGIFAHSISPICPHGNMLCEMLAEPPHAHYEIPTDQTFTVTSAPISGSNVHVGIQSINLAVDLRPAK